MLGEIIGDVVGSVYEFNPLKGDWRDFPLFGPGSRFTDDTVMTFAVAEALMSSAGNGHAFHDAVREWMRVMGRQYPHAGYGAHFRVWIYSPDAAPYNSFGNGSAMRVSPVGWAFTSLAETEKFAALSAAPTHDHPEGIKGAQAVAGSIFLARRGKTRNEIAEYVSGRYGYELGQKVRQIRECYHFDETCQGSVPQALVAFLESACFEEAVRKAVWLGGDADTQAAIAGSVAEAFYGCPPAWMASEALARLDDNLRGAYQRWRQWLILRQQS